MSELFICDVCHKSYDPALSSAVYFARGAVCSKECFDADCATPAPDATGLREARVTSDMVYKALTERLYPFVSRIHCDMVAANLNEALAATPAQPSRAQIVQIIAEIADERGRQDKKWGGPQRDDGHLETDWIEYISEHAHRAERGIFRKQMIRVAALAIAAIESHDRLAAQPTPEQEEKR